MSRILYGIINYLSPPSGHLLGGTGDRELAFRTQVNAFQTQCCPLILFMSVKYVIHQKSHLISIEVIPWARNPAKTITTAK